VIGSPLAGPAVRKNVHAWGEGLTRLFLTRLEGPAPNLADAAASGSIPDPDSSWHSFPKQPDV
jgi:hypothetical protein